MTRRPSRESQLPSPFGHPNSGPWRKLNFYRRGTSIRKSSTVCKKDSMPTRKMCRLSQRVSLASNQQGSQQSWSLTSRFWRNKFYRAKLLLHPSSSPFRKLHHSKISPLDKFKAKTYKCKRATQEHRHHLQSRSKIKFNLWVSLQFSGGNKYRTIRVTTLRM